MQPSAFVLALTAVLGINGTAPNVLAEEAAAKKSIATPIVLRISKRLVEQMTDEEIEFSLPVTERFGDMPIDGTVTTRSKVNVTLLTSNKTATCLLTASGKAHATLTASKGPVTAYGQAWIPYRLKTQVTFDGVKFKAHPVVARLEVSSQIDEISTCRNGPLAMCVRRIAARTIDKAKPELDAHLYNRAKHKFEVELAAVARELVDELNSTNRLDEMIAKHFPESKSWVYHVSSTDEIILAAVGPKNATIPPFRTRPNGTMKASMDLWVQTSWEETLVINASLLWNSTHDLLKEVLPADIARSLAQHVTITTEGNWFVVTIGRGAIQMALEEAEK